MIKNTRKGFTTVELVIVIAVIAILATALIPTFGGLINSANDTKYMQEARQAYNDYMLKDAAAASSGTYYIETTGGTYYKVTEGKFDTDKAKTADDADFATCKTTICVVNKDGTYTWKVNGNHADTTSPADGICDTCGEKIPASNG